MKYGISELSIVAVRKQPDDKSEIINQILFGEHFKVLKEEINWSYIQLAHDKYEGWICNKQWLEIQEDVFKDLNKQIPTITTDIVSTIKKNTPQTIVMGSILPFYNKNQTIIGNKTYTYEGLNTIGFVKKEDLINNAKIYINTPYLWGGRSPFGIDCSGFIQIIYRLQGFKLPRDAYQQAEEGKIIESIELSKEGDLAFFENKKNKITHVGLILKENKIIHASGKVRIDNIDDKGIFNLDKKKYTHQLRSIKRILE